MSTSIVYPGATHSFLEAMSIAEVARRAIRDGADWVKRGYFSPLERSRGGSSRRPAISMS